MNLNPSTTLKWSALVCAVLWSGWMVWWIGSFDLPTLVIFSIGGLLFGLGWYVAMRFIFESARLLSRDDRQPVDLPRGTFNRWIVWSGLMVVTGIATACLLDLVNPLIPAGNWHWLIRSLFVVVVWPALAWSLRPLLKRHLPA